MKNNKLLKFNILLSFLYFALMGIDYLRLTHTHKEDIAVGLMFALIVLFAIPHLITQAISLILACIGLSKDNQKFISYAALTHTLSTFVCFPYFFFAFIYYYFIISLLITFVWIKIWRNLNKSE